MKNTLGHLSYCFLQHPADHYLPAGHPRLWRGFQFQQERSTWRHIYACVLLSHWTLFSAWSFLFTKENLCWSWWSAWCGLSGNMTEMSPNLYVDSRDIGKYFAKEVRDVRDKLCRRTLLLLHCSQIIWLCSEFATSFHIRVQRHHQTIHQLSRESLFKQCCLRFLDNGTEKLLQQVAREVQIGYKCVCKFQVCFTSDIRV